MLYKYNNGGKKLKTRHPSPLNVAWRDTRKSPDKLISRRAGQVFKCGQGMMLTVPKNSYGAEYGPRGELKIRVHSGCQGSSRPSL